MSHCNDIHDPSKCGNTSWSADVVKGFVAEPNCGRGTVGIIWSCLTVMVFSAWSVIHIDTRPLASSWSNERSGLFWRPWQTLIHKFNNDSKTHASGFYLGPTTRKICTALALILFPEYGLLVAVEELTLARLIQHRTRELDGWESFSLRQGHLVRMGGITVPHIDRAEDFPNFVLQNAHILRFEHFPSDARIALRAKRDFIDKAIALSQVVYFISNIATRSSRGYRIMGLEFLTLNYIGIAVVTFLFRIKKPQELYEPFELDLSELPSPVAPIESSELRKPRMERWIWLGMVFAFALVYAIPWLALPGRKRDLTDLTNSGEGQTSGVTLIGAIAVISFMLRRKLESSGKVDGSVFRKAIWYAGVIIMYLAGLAYISFRIMLLYNVSESFKDAVEGIFLTPTSWTRYLGHFGA